MATIAHHEVTVETDGVHLAGNLDRPEAPGGLVLFAHGSGSSRLSPRNQRVASILNEAGLATLLLDLLTPSEHERDRMTAALRFDIPLLARRLVGALDWTEREPHAAGLPIGLFGASTGAAAALIAAAERPQRVRAVVSRGGRPDLADTDLPRVRVPVLLLVGSWDREVYALNDAAARRLGGPWRLVRIAEAGHLFEEPGKLEQVATAAAEWFCHYMNGLEHLEHTAMADSRSEPST